MKGVSRAALARFAAQARRSARLDGSVNVVVSDDRELRALNRRYRGKDRVTDVLSFPSIPSLDGHFGGDVVVSAQTAARNARALGHPVAAELKILILHGMLHLAGYDHERDHGRMARTEDRLRRRFHLPVALIARSGRSAERRR